MGTEPSIDVLQVITTTARRGAERFAMALEPELIARGLRVRTMALCEGEGDGLDVPTLGASRLGPGTLFALRRNARAARVVVAHGSTTLPATAIATLGLRTPFVYRNIGDPYFWASSAKRRLMLRASLRRAAAVVALTEETGRRLGEVAGVPSERITPIPRGVPAVDFPHRSAESRRAARSAYGFDADAKVAVCVGALSPEKDVVTAVRAIAALDDRWHLLIAGDGPDRRRVEEEAAQLEAGRVRVLGHCPDPGQVMTAADVLLLPSRTEGVPGVIIESGMIGVPAIASDVGFIRSIVDDGVTGVLVSPGSPGELAEAVRAAEPRLDAFGDAAHESISRRYSLTASADGWHRVLDPLMARRN